MILDSEILEHAAFRRWLLNLSIGYISVAEVRHWLCLWRWHDSRKSGLGTQKGIFEGSSSLVISWKYWSLGVLEV